MNPIRRGIELFDTTLVFLLGRRLKGKLEMLPSFAAAMAFYFLVSLVPFLIVVSRGVAAVFHANLTPELFSFLGKVLPPESQLSLDAIAASITESSTGLAAVSTFLAIWTASSGLNEVSRAVHYLFSEPEKDLFGGWRLRGKAFGVLGIWALAAAGLCLAFVILPLAQEGLQSYGVGRLLPKWLAAGYRYPVAFAMVFFAFASTYAFVPESSTKWRAVVAGAAVAAASWSGVSLMFAYLLPKVWHVSMFNGALSSVLAILIWAYCGAWGVLIGALVTVRLDEV